MALLLSLERGDRVPRPLRKVTGQAITSIPTKAWDRAFWRQNRAGERIHKLARLMKSTDHDSMYFDLLTLWRELSKTVVFVTHSVFESVYLAQRIVVMTPRPGRIFDEIVIDAPYPRDESFRTSAEYAALCRKVSQALAAAVAKSGA